MVNFCDFQTIYAASHYCVPQKVVEEWYRGKGFGNKTPYTESERARLKEDINAMGNRLLEAYQAAGKKEIVMTAGSPGAGKTVLLESLIRKEPGALYSDPDAYCLKNMQKTYQLELEEELAKTDCDSQQIHKRMYDKWRSASNAAAHMLLAYFISINAPFYFGTTASGDKTSGTLNYFKERGYKIEVIHVIAPDDVRIVSVKNRDKNFVQTTDEDIENKGKLVPQRINDTYLKFADTIHFYYRGQVDRTPILAATWIRKEKRGELNVYNLEAYQAMVKVHNAICDKLQDASILWENSVEKASNLTVKNFS